MALQQDEVVNPPYPLLRYLQKLIEIVDDSGHLRTPISQETEYWINGMLEYWNIGFEYEQEFLYPSFTIPLSHFL